MTSTPRLRRLLAAVAGAALIGAGTGACQSRTAGPQADAQRSPAPVPVPVLVAGDAHGSTPWQRPLTVTAREGTLVAAVLVDGQGQLVQGQLDGNSWTSTGALAPGATYRLFARVTDLGGTTLTMDRAVRTTSAPDALRAVLTPDNRVVGIGEPAAVILDRPVTNEKDRALVEQRLSVETDPPVAGAWRWMSPNELHYRGPTYWASGTQVKVHVDFTGLRLHDGSWGEGVHDSSFTIGSAVIATVDVEKLVMTVTVNGALVRTVKVSTGRDKYPTKGGVHIVLEKVKVEVMDSQTVGIPRNSPDGYFEKVPNSVRISYGGAFVHSASWSVADQGVRNVSHGCVNISPADAAWFFGLVKRGDIVNIVHAKAPPLLSDPGMSDWNIPFSAWAN